MKIIDWFFNNATKIFFALLAMVFIFWQIVGENFGFDIDNFMSVASLILSLIASALIFCLLFSFMFVLGFILEKINMNRVKKINGTNPSHNPVDRPRHPV